MVKQGPRVRDGWNPMFYQLLAPKLDNFREKSLPFTSLSKPLPFKSVGNDVTRRPIRTYLRPCDACIILLLPGYSVKWYPGINGFQFMSHLPVMHHSPILPCYDHYHFLLGSKSNQHVCK